MSKDPQGIIDPAVGRQTALAMKQEKNWGELSDAGGGYDSGWSFIPYVSNDISGDIEPLDDETITGNRSLKPSLAGTITVEGDIELNIDPDTNASMFVWALGGYNSESGVDGQAGITHGFYGEDLQDSDADLPSFSLIRKLGVMDLRLQGGKVDSLSIDQGLGEILTGTLSTVFRDEELPPSSEVPSNDVPDITPFIYREGNIKVDFNDGSGLQEIAEIEDFSLDIANNLESDPSINSGAFIAYLKAMGRDITGSMTVKYEDSTFFEAYNDDVEMEVHMEWESEEIIDGENKKLFIRLPLVKFLSAPQPVPGGDEVLSQDIDFEARRNDSATQELPDGTELEGFDIYAEIHNDTAADAYIADEEDL